jgi:hypothetical protein
MNVSLPPPPNLECSDIDEENFEVRGSNPHGFDDDNDGVGCEEDSTTSPEEEPEPEPEEEPEEPQSELERLLEEREEQEVEEASIAIYVIRDSSLVYWSWL